MQIEQAIAERRSIRRYTATMPPRDLVQQVLEAARWAPSWANTQCSEFIVVADTGIKEQLAKTLPEKNPARSAMLQAPLVIAACARAGISGFFKGKPATDKGDWMMFDTALALQNLTLCAHALGLGTVHVGFFDAIKAGEILNVPSETRVIELLPLGYPADAGTKTPRRPLTDFVFYDRHGNNTCCI